MHSPYVIIVGDYIVALFSHYSKLHRVNHVFNWDIYISDINTFDKEVTYIPITIEEFFELKDQIIDESFNVGFGREQERMARNIREEERHSGRPLPKRDLYKALKMAKLLDSAYQPLRIRKAYRFEAARQKKLEAENKGESYDYLTDRQLMLTLKDVENYKEDLLNMKAHGYPIEGFPLVDDLFK
jgi:hypothetical protein